MRASYLYENISQLMSLRQKRISVSLLSGAEEGECVQQPVPARKTAFALCASVSLLLLWGVHTHPNLDNTTLSVANVHTGRLPLLRSPFPNRYPEFSALHSSFPVVPSQLSAPRFPVPLRRSLPISHAYSESALLDDPRQMQQNSSNAGESETAVISAERAELKRSLFTLCASYDRGFGATPESRKDVDEIIKKLEAINPTPTNATRGIEGGLSTQDHGLPPMEGIWRMVWTTAQDVLNLGASPVVLPGAIYQVIQPPMATNIIDFIPRAQALLPAVFPSTLLRAEIEARASEARRVPNSKFNRVELTFESVKVAPVEVLGIKADLRQLDEWRLKNLGSGIVPQLNFDYPQIDLKELPGVDPEKVPAFFDVLYLDEDMLIVKQRQIKARINRSPSSKSPEEIKQGQAQRFRLPKLPFRPPKPPFEIPKAPKVWQGRPGKYSVFTKVSSFDP